MPRIKKETAPVVETSKYDPYEDKFLEQYWDQDMFVSEFDMPDMRAAETTQSLLQDSLVHQTKQIIGSQEVTNVTMKDKIVKQEIITDNGKITLRVVTLRGKIPTQTVSGLVAKQFAQGQGFLVGKDEQQINDFNRMGI